MPDQSYQEWEQQIIEQIQTANTSVLIDPAERAEPRSGGACCASNAPIGIDSQNYNEGRSVLCGDYVTQNNQNVEIGINIPEMVPLAEAIEAFRTSEEARSAYYGGGTKIFHHKGGTFYFTSYAQEAKQMYELLLLEIEINRQLQAANTELLHRLRNLE